jgi:streptomycin 6-kinase
MLPPLLISNVAGNWGAEGRRWLGELPGLIERTTERWRLTVEQLYPMTFHWVALVRTADGGRAVLKLGVPDGHLDDEAEALRVFDGDGSVRLLAEDRSAAALLIENAEPGTPVASLVPHEDAAATEVLIGIGRRLHRVPPEKCSLPHLRGHGEAFRGYLRQPGGPIPRAMVQRAAELFDDLCASAPREVVLHGDLHHGNVLRAGADRWLAIDPHGAVGDPGYDGGALLYNPDPADRDPALLRLVPARIEQLADGADPGRVIAWGFVMGVLSEVWSVGADPAARTRALDVATLLLPRLA